MTNWFERLFDCFVNFRNCHNWRCRYHNVHWQDEIVVNGNTSTWLYHGNPIAVLQKYTEDMYMLILSDAGYSTLSTIDRLNGIIRLLNDYDIRIPIEFKLKYSSMNGGKPLYTYIVENDKKYLTGTVTAVIRKSKVIAIKYDEDKEVEFIMDNPRLQKYRKTYKEIIKIISEIEEIFEKVEKAVEEGVEVPIEVVEVYREYQKLRNEFFMFCRNVFVMGIETILGVFVKKLSEADKIREYKRKFIEFLPKAQEALALVQLLK